MATNVPMKSEGKGKSPAPSSPFYEMEQWAEQLLPRGWSRPFEMMEKTLAHLPEIDVIERDNEILVKASVAGFGKDELEVSATETSVTLKGKMRKEKEEKKEDGEYYRREIRSADFMRTVRLPAPVDDTKAVAHYKDGLLEITLPKVEGSRRHTVAIQED